MIKDYNKAADYIANWIKDYMTGAKADKLVLGLSGGIDSALCALLIKRANLPLVCVNMPCHSSSSAYNRAKVFADENGIELLKVDLAEAHQSISSQLTGQAEYDWTSKGSAGGLRSCLRAPTLSFVAHAVNGLIVGTGNRSEDRITRYFQKFGDGCVDFSPIADLWKSEVRALFEFLATVNGEFQPGAKAILDAKPTADLWGEDAGQEDEKELGISYDEIEWADKQDVETKCLPWDFDDGHPGIIFTNRDPETYVQYSEYSERQRFIIKTLHKMEKVSRHKANPNMPICIMHNGVECLF